MTFILKMDLVIITVTAGFLALAGLDFAGVAWELLFS
jgi:hypothetical protein